MTDILLTEEDRMLQRTVAELPDRGVRACLLPVGGSQLELIQPTDLSGAVARFIQRRARDCTTSPSRWTISLSSFSASRLAAWI